MSRHVTSCHVMSCHVMSHHVTSCHVMSRHATSCHVMYLMSRHVISRNVTSCHVTSCHVMSHLAPSCHVMPYHVTSYHVESRGTVTRPTLHCQLTSSTRNQFKLSMTMFVGCPEGCRYNTASAVYDLVFHFIMSKCNASILYLFRIIVPKFQTRRKLHMLSVLNVRFNLLLLVKIHMFVAFVERMRRVSSRQISLH